MKASISILFLIISNVFMTLAWYGHLHYFKKSSLVMKWGLPAVILISWGLAFFEYVFQVPANKIGYQGNNGPFSLFELKMIQEAVSLIVFTGFTVWVFKSDKLAWNHLVGFGFLMVAVFFIFKKW